MSFSDSTIHDIYPKETMMPTLKPIIFALMLVCALLMASAAIAQVPPDNNVDQPAGQVISMVTASATSERVRFSSPNTVVQLRLEVYDEAGQKLVDTEQRGGNVLDWHLQQGAGERVPDGVYLCVLTSKTLSGRISQKLGQVTVSGQATAVRSAAVADLNLHQAQTVGPVESGETGLTVMGAADAPVTVLANNGSDAQLARTRGALTFRVGDFFSGNDTEQMRLTEDGNLGLGTTQPKTRLDVAGMIRAREGLMFSDGSTLNVNENGVLTRTSADGVTPSVVTTQNKIAKFTDTAGSVGDSVMAESAGKIGINTVSPTQALDVLNGRIVTTGSQTLASTSDSMIEVKSTITNNGLAQSAIKARNTFDGSGDFVTGLDAAPTFAPSASISTAQGFVAAAFFAPPPGVTITNAIGGASATVYNNVSGAVTNGTAFNIVSPFVFGALKPTTQYGLHINNQGIAGTTNTYGLFVDAQSGSTNNVSAIFAGGNVGIGTINPINGKLQVVATGGSDGVYVVSASGDGVTVQSSSGTGVFGQSASGNGVFGQSTSSGDGVLGQSSSGIGVYGFSSTGPGVRAHSTSGNLVEGTDGSGTQKFHIDISGTYTAGSDFAEALPASGNRAGYEPGDVLVVSTKAPGKIEKSSQPYDPRVAGIYSTRPGVLGADKNGTSRVDKDDVPVAIVGIVPTKVSAMNGPIGAGDLLTTSSVPGYAMRCTNRVKCVGAIVGKALEPLAGGKGVIKVLVMLR
jgi:hypothetical protein